MTTSGGKSSGGGSGGGAGARAGPAVVSDDAATVAAIARLLGSSAPVRELGTRRRVSRPAAGLYPLRASGTQWVAPVPPSSMGHGPMQFMGVWDTQPELEPYDDATHKALGMSAMPGGATLRWGLPRATQYVDAAVAHSSIAPAISYPGALTLYVAGVDVIPAGWRDADTWPGLPVGYTARVSDLLVDDTVWARGLTEATLAHRVDTALSDAGRDMSDGVRYLARHVARPVLDLLAYAGAPALEADLSELAGGARYVAAWLRFWWPAYDGVDPMSASALDIPWAVLPGPSRYACHRSAWHVALPVTASALTYATWTTSIADPSVAVARYGVASPIGGLWQVLACANARAADGTDCLQLALELRTSDVISRTTGSWNYNEHLAALAPSWRHAGSGVVIAAYPATLADPITGLVSISVVP